ncbi:putative serine racemase [Colletotrichum siamense]|uniref:putative serine racemase n=1 Tax=Colletotrichum siamense TaxID=690259 RepID=UPI001872CF7A|nr:putative serine racemase [Colletotrichum siamense]KAF5495370.1 putative serine racemase [Colletotrichum siamense]
MASLATCPPLTRESVFEARKLIQTHVHKTPVLTNKTLSQMASTPRASSTLGDRKPAKPIIRLWFKCENMQRIGAFKARGAFHAIERLKQEPGWLENDGKTKGVVGFSAGNHAQALALAARENGIAAHIVMPSTTRPYKIDATKGYGANVVVCGPKDREAVAARIVSETGARLVPPFDHPDVILGQATVGLEMQDQIESLDAVIAPCSGGGLLSGVALSCEGTGVKVFGAEPEFEGGDDGRRGYYSGKRVTEVSTRTIADGLIGVVGARPWDIIYERRLVSGMYAVSEEEIWEATKLILERLKLVVEPAAAVPLAVALFNEEFRVMVEEAAGEKGWDLGLVLSGGNIGVDGLAKLFS